jgi:aryl-alcohol dehydrogenase-like predicted oxidoreductase
MEFPALGNSSLNVSAITFGAWAAGGWMWGGNEEKDAIAAIQAGFDLGVTSIDTAPAYGQGASERIVGKAIRSIPRDKVQILTKYGLRWDTTKGTFHFKSKDNEGREINMHKYAGREGIIKEVEDSLRLLGTDYIDLYQIHWHDPSTPIQETMETIAELIKQGKVLQAGVCNYDAALMAEAEKYVPLVSNQVPYSMIKRDIEAELVPYCLAHQKSILAYSPMERGLLSGKITPGHQFAEGDHRASLYYFKEKNLQKVNSFLDHLRPLAADKGVALSQLVLRWTLAQPGITALLVGARNAEQAISNAKTMEVSLTPEEISFITQHLNPLTLDKSL